MINIGAKEPKGAHFVSALCHPDPSRLQREPRYSHGRIVTDCTEAPQDRPLFGGLRAVLAYFSAGHQVPHAGKRHSDETLLARYVERLLGDSGRL